MSDFDRNIATARAGYRPEVAIDAGLRAYMIRVYNYMMAGMALTRAGATERLRSLTPGEGDDDNE